MSETGGAAFGFSLPEMTFALIFSRERVCTEAPPVARWCIGRPFDEVYSYWTRRGAQVQRLREE